MYAGRKEWDLGKVEVTVEYETPRADTAPRLDVRIRIPAELSDEQRERLLVIAGKCPVHRTLAAQDVEPTTRSSRSRPSRWTWGSGAEPAW